MELYTLQLSEHEKPTLTIKVKLYMGADDPGSKVNFEMINVKMNIVHHSHKEGGMIK